MKLKTILIFLALFAISPSANSASRADADRLAKETIEAEDVVTGLEKDRDNFERNNPKEKNWTAEMKQQYEKILAEIEKAEAAAAAKYKEWVQADLASLAPSKQRKPAAGNASEHVNSSCPFANDTLAFSPGAAWRADGKVRFNKADVKLENIDANSQTAILKARGVPFSAPAKGSGITQVRIEYSEDGKLSRLELEDSRFLRAHGKTAPSFRKTLPDWKQTMEYSWNGDECSVKSVSVNTPELDGKTGVSFDQELCRAFERKGLLDENKIDECTDYNDRLGNEIEKATKGYGDKKAFALFTTDPSGRTSLRAWKKKDHLSVNASIARDCAYHLKKGQRAANPGSSSRDQENIRSGTTAR